MGRIIVLSFTSVEHAVTPSGVIVTTDSAKSRFAESLSGEYNIAISMKKKG